MSAPAIAQDIFARLAAGVSTHSLPALYFPFVGGEPDVEHLRPRILPAMTESRGVDGWDVERGIAQVSVYTKQGLGDIHAYSIAERILDLFARGWSTENVKVDVAGYLSPVFIDGGWCALHVSIPYVHVR